MARWWILLLCAATAQSQFLIGVLGASDIRHAATQLTGSVSGLAPGQWFSSRSSQRPLSVSIRSANVTRDIPLITRDGLTLGRVPDDQPLGVAEFSIRYTSSLVITTSVRITENVPGLLSRWSTGSGSAQALHTTRVGTVVSNTVLNPAVPGDTVSLFATGLTQPRDLRAHMGDQLAPVTYAGPAPNLPGVQQINVEIPASLNRLSCYVPVWLDGAGWISNTVTIAITASPNVPCKHPLRLGVDALRKLEAGDTIPFGTGRLRQEVESREPASHKPPLTSGDAFLSLRLANAREIDALIAADVNEAQPGCNRMPTGATSIALFAGLTLTRNSLDAGSPVMLAGPGVGYDLSARDFLSVLPKIEIRPGLWTVNAPGGRDVGPFNFFSRVDPPFRWTSNFDPNRPGEVEIQWDPAEYHPDSHVDLDVPLTGIFDPLGAPPGTDGALGVHCSASVRTGKLTIPGSFWNQLKGSLITVSLSRTRENAAIVPLRPTQTGPEGVVYFTFLSEETRFSLAP